MEEAWELAVVSEIDTKINNYLYRKAGPLPLRTLRMMEKTPIRIFLLIYSFVLSALFLHNFPNNNFISEYPSLFSLMTDFKSGGFFKVFFVAIIFWLASIWFFSTFRRLQLMSTSTYEFENDLVKKEILDIQSKIEREKDAEAQIKLKKQEKLLRAELTASLRENFRDSEGKITDDWREALVLSRNRLTVEAGRLTARSRTNLQLGIWLSGIAVATLFALILFHQPKSTPAGWMEFSVYYAPRFTLVIIIQLLAGFFLRMFVQNEKDISKNKNEITNLELRIAAGLMTSSAAQRAKLSEKLISEERNFVLAKKEKSASSSDNAKGASEFITSLKDFIKEVKS